MREYPDSCSACQKAATGGPNLHVRLYGDEHSGVNKGGHDQVHCAAISSIRCRRKVGRGKFL